MTNTKPCHILIGDTPFCDWLSCPAGRDISKKANVCTCDQRSLAAGQRAAKALAPFFKPGVVRVAPGRCVSV